MQTTTYNIHEAKTHFSKLIQAAMNGEEIIIAKAGQPVVKLEPIVLKKERKFGVLKGKIHIPDSFYEPLPEDILRAFAGEKD